MYYFFLFLQNKKEMESISAMYVKGTDPSTKYSDLMCLDTVISIMFHSILYLVVFLILFAVMTNTTMKFKSAIILWLIFVLIMVIGYPIRLMRAKQLMAITNSKKETQNIMNSAYACWYFLG